MASELQVIKESEIGSAQTRVSYLKNFPLQTHWLPSSVSCRGMHHLAIGSNDEGRKLFFSLWKTEEKQWVAELGRERVKSSKTFAFMTQSLKLPWIKTLYRLISDFVKFVLQMQPGNWLRPPLTLLKLGKRVINTPALLTTGAHRNPLKCIWRRHTSTVFHRNEVIKLESCWQEDLSKTLKTISFPTH